MEYRASGKPQTCDDHLQGNITSKSKLIQDFKEFTQKNDKGYRKPFFSLVLRFLILLINALTLSQNSFTTLGFGRIPTTGLARYVCIIQGFIGLGGVYTTFIGVSPSSPTLSSSLIKASSEVLSYFIRVLISECAVSFITVVAGIPLSSRIVTHERLAA